MTKFLSAAKKYSPHGGRNSKGRRNVVPCWKVITIKLNGKERSFGLFLYAVLRIENSQNSVRSRLMNLVRTGEPGWKVTNPSS